MDRFAPSFLDDLEDVEADLASFRDPEAATLDEGDDALDAEVEAILRNCGWHAGDER